MQDPKIPLKNQKRKTAQMIKKKVLFYIMLREKVDILIRSSIQILS